LKGDKKYSFSKRHFSDQNKLGKNRTYYDYPCRRRSSKVEKKPKDLSLPELLVNLPR
jgi:hypothetical protein